MKKNEVTIGGVYKAKVTNKVVDVRIDRENAGGGWNATNLATKKKITIKSAQRLRRPVNDAAKAKRETTKKPADAKTAKARKDAIKEIDQRLSASEGAPGGDTPATVPATAKHKAQGTKAATDVKNATRAKDAAHSKKTDDSPGGVAMTVFRNQARADAAQKRRADHATRPNARASAKPGVKPGVKRMSLLDAAAEVLAKSDEPMGAKLLVEAAVEKKLWTPGAGKTPQATLYAAIIREMAKKGDEARFEKVDRGRFQRKGA